MTPTDRDPRLWLVLHGFRGKIPRSLVFSTSLVVALTIVLAPASGWSATEQDPDLQLLDEHFKLHLGGTVASAGFGTGALVGGIHNFVLFGEGQPTFFLALSLTALGTATIVSSATSTQQTVANWQVMRRRLGASSSAQRRLIREAEAFRLRRAAVQRSIGLAADGTFLGIGIALMVATAPELGLPLVLDGAVLLGIDIYRIVVDDQVARKWLSRDRNADRSYFSRGLLRRRGPVAPPFLLTASMLPSRSKLRPGGLMVLAAGLF